MDNGTMVESFKYLNYYQVAKSSLVSKRYWNLIRTHRHRLALLHIDEIYMTTSVQEFPSVIKMFNKELSVEEYNEFIARNGYSKQVPLECQIAEKESSEKGRDIYELNVYQSPNNCRTTVFFARTELKDETWPLFQHFIRLLTDPFICIRTLSLYSQEVFTLLAGAMNPDQDRLQCKLLNISFIDDTQKCIVWIKNQVRCDELNIQIDNGLNYDEELLDLFLTGAPCTSLIKVTWCYLTKVMVDFVQKFMGLKSRNEYQLVESAKGTVEDREIVEKLKRNFAEFIVEEDQYEERRSTNQVIGFINNDIGKKLTLYVEIIKYGGLDFFIKITNL